MQRVKFCFQVCMVHVLIGGPLAIFARKDAIPELQEVVNGEHPKSKIRTLGQV